MRITKYIFSLLLLTAIFLSSCSSNRMVAKSNALIRLPQKTVVINKVNPNTPQDLFNREEMKLEMSIIQQTPTPIWIPPVISKVLIMPYVDSDGNLHSYQFAYVELQKGKWLLGNYLYRDQQTERFIDPLNASDSPAGGSSQNTGASAQTDLHRKKTTTTGVQPTAASGKTSVGFFNGGNAGKKMSNNEMYFNNAVKHMEESNQNR